MQVQMMNAESLRQDRVCGVPTKREVRLGGARAGGAELRRVGQGGARRGARRCGKSDGDERLTDDAIDPRISGQRRGAEGGVPTARFPGEVHCRGHRAAGGSGPGARAVERAGHAPDSASASACSSGTSGTSGWRRSVWRICTTCAPARA